MAKCIYCFEKFYLTEIDFRAKSPIYLINSDLNNKNNFPIDEKLRDYYINRLGFDFDTAENIAENELPCFSLKDDGIIYNIETDEETGREYVFSITFDKEIYKSNTYETDIILCPHCHNVVPHAFGLIDTLIISLIGDTFSGKTVFLSVLIRELLMGSGNFRSSLIALMNKDLENNINSNINRLYNERLVPQPTHIKAQPPLIYNYRYTYIDNDFNKQEKSLNLVFYDIAGENCRDNTTLEKIGPNVENSDGIIFIISPMAMEGVSSYFNVHGVNSEDPNLQSNLEVIRSICTRFLFKDSKKSKIPIAITLSKIDIFSKEDFVFPYFEKHPHSKMLINEETQISKHNMYLNKTEIEDINSDVLDFLESLKVYPFIDGIKNYFEVNNYFAVSALNQLPEDKIIDGKTVQVLNKEINPYRILEPFYWLLNQNNYLDTRREQLEIPKKTKNLFSFFKNKK